MYMFFMGKLDRETVETIAEAYVSGLSLKEIGLLLHVNESTVRYHLLRMGEAIRKRGRPRVREKVDGQVKEIIG